MKGRSDKSICFMDFDGTIVDNKYRLYQFWVENVDSRYQNILELEEFWLLKRLGVNEVEWLNQKMGTQYSVTEWNAKKAEVIEQEYYLQYERVFDYSYETLTRLREKYHLVLVTRRDNTTGLMVELERFGLKEIFDDILTLAHGDVKKSEMILANYDVRPDDILVGDTEDDIIAGVDLGVRTFLTLSGIRGRWIVDKVNLQQQVKVIETIKELL